MSERTDTKRSILACSASLKRRRASLVNVCSLTPSDLTVLAPPDDEVLPDQAGAYGALVDAATPLPIADMTERAEASLLSLDGEWFGCKAERIGYALWLSDAAKGIEGGMMGSPILVNDRAVGGEHTQHIGNICGSQSACADRVLTAMACERASNRCEGLSNAAAWRCVAGGAPVSKL
jgi:hypothetical protein